VLVVLRIIGVFNAAIWFGSGIFFTFGVARGIFHDPEIRQVFAPPGGPMGDFYLGFIAQSLISKYFVVNLVCCLIAIGHFFAEIIYAGKPFRRLPFALLIGILSLGLLGAYVFTPKIKALHQAKYLGKPDERPPAAKQLARLHATSMSANLITLIALAIYVWQVTNPPDHMRFVSAKFRG
jgi:hypothetical protein